MGRTLAPVSSILARWLSSHCRVNELTFLSGTRLQETNGIIEDWWGRGAWKVSLVHKNPASVIN